MRRALEMDARPFEGLLGPGYLALNCGSGRHCRGEVYTPRTVALTMARRALAAKDLPDDRPITVLEPACGSGALLLALAEARSIDHGVPPSHLYVGACDLSRTATHLAAINLACCGIPATVVHGTTLSGQTFAVHWTPALTVDVPIHRPQPKRGHEPSEGSRQPGLFDITPWRVAPPSRPTSALSGRMGRWSGGESRTMEAFPNESSDRVQIHERKTHDPSPSKPSRR